MIEKPKKAFILAAGMGTRLRPYTDTMPKPMVAINGISIIRRAIEKLQQAGVCEIVINLHYLADVLKDHLADICSPNIILSYEDALLNTGGGVQKQISRFEGKPFYIINGDALWDDGTPTALERLANKWDGNTMDILLLLEPEEKMISGFVGDYDCDVMGHAIRNTNKEGTYMFAGIRIAHPRIFDGLQEGSLSFLSLMDKAQQDKRLFGVVHNDAWYHISTPEDLEAVDALYKKRGI